MNANKVSVATPRGVSPTFDDMLPGGFAIIAEDESYAGEVVVKTYGGRVVSLSNPATHLWSAPCPIRVKLLPKGVAITIETDL